jgi:hypothetical protein
MQCEECQLPLWKAGEIVPAGTYARVDDQSYKIVRLDQEGPLPAAFDGHIAWYCATAWACACMEHAHQTLATSGTRDRRTEGPSAPVPLKGKSNADQ